MPEYLISLATLGVGVTFVFSGVVKLGDVRGFSLKIEEYYRLLPTSLSAYLAHLLPYTSVMAVGMAALEAALGSALLFHWQHRGVLGILLGLTLSFASLTLYTAISKRLTSCGCLGSAVVLTPWQSFIKNVILLYLIGVLLRQKEPGKSTHHEGSKYPSACAHDHDAGVGPMELFCSRGSTVDQPPGNLCNKIGK